MKATLTSHQEEIHDAIVGKIVDNIYSPFKGEVEDHFISLSGAAGTGKSFITAQIVNELLITLYGRDKIDDNGICVTAPTHKAVSVIRDMLEKYNISVDCKTIQSFLAIKPINDYKTGEERYVVDRRRKHLSQATLLIVDESSMVSHEIYMYLVEAFKRNQFNTVLFIGDSYQLLPVNSLDNPVFDLKEQYELTEVVRQATDSNIIKLATLFRERLKSQDFIPIQQLVQNVKEANSNDIEFFTSRELFIEDFHKNRNWEQENNIITSFANKDVESFNKVIREQSWLDNGVDNPVQFLQGDKIRFKSAYDSQVKVSTFRKNTPIYSNGEEVTIREAKLITHQTLNISFWECRVYGRNDNDFFRVVDSKSIDNFNKLLNEYVHLAKTAEHQYSGHYWKYYFDIKSKFADIQYIYASTIHKLQGSTYDTANIDLTSIANNQQISNDLKYRLAYVAITRARQNIKILL